MTVFARRPFLKIIFFSALILSFFNACVFVANAAEANVNNRTYTEVIQYESAFFQEYGNFYANPSNYTNGIAVPYDPQNPSAQFYALKPENQKKVLEYFEPIKKFLSEAKSLIRDNDSLYASASNYKNGAVTGNFFDLNEDSQKKALDISRNFQKATEGVDKLTDQRNALGKIIGSFVEYQQKAINTAADATKDRVPLIGDGLDLIRDMVNSNDAISRMIFGQGLSDLGRGTLRLAPKPQTTPKPDTGLCYAWNGLNGGFTFNIKNCIEHVMAVILSILAFIIGTAAEVFNFVIIITVERMAVLIDQLGVITIAWDVIRDLVNIFFIFLLLFLAIKQILGTDDHGVKHTLSRLIIVAIFINFSLFFTKTIIDASNILTLEFYNKINIEDRNGDRTGMGDALMSVFNLQTFYAPDGVSSVTEAIKQYADRTQQFATASFGNNLVRFGMGIVFMLTALSLMLGAIWIFIKRFIVFIGLMITSPIGFAGGLVSGGEEAANEWWKSLIAECLVAPIFMIGFWVVFQIIRDGRFASLIVGEVAKVSGGPQGFVVSEPIASFTFLNFLIVIFMLGGVMTAAASVGSAGGHKAVDSFNKWRNRLIGTPLNAGYRNTIGRAAYWALEKGWEEKIRGAQAHPEEQGWATLRRIPLIGKALNRFTGQQLEKSLHGLAGYGIELGKDAHGEHGAGGDHHAAPGSHMADQKEMMEEMERYLYEVRGDPYATARMYVDGMQGNKDDRRRQATEKMFESKEGQQGEILGTLDYMIQDKQAAVDALLSAGKTQDANKESEHLKRLETARTNLEGRLSYDEKESVRRKMEQSLNIQRYRMDKFKFGDRISDDDMKKVVGDRNTVLDETKTLDERFGTLSIDQLKKQRDTTNDSQLRDVLKRAADERASRMRQEFASLNTTQRVKLAPETLADESLDGLLSSHDLEQLQRSATLSPEVRHRVQQQLEQQLDDYHRIADELVKGKNSKEALEKTYSQYKEYNRVRSAPDFLTKANLSDQEVQKIYDAVNQFGIKVRKEEIQAAAVDQEKRRKLQTKLDSEFTKVEDSLNRDLASFAKYMEGNGRWWGNENESKSLLKKVTQIPVRGRGGQSQSGNQGGGGSNPPQNNQTSQSYNQQPPGNNP